MLTLAQIDHLLTVYRPWMTARYPATATTRRCARAVVDQLLDARLRLTTSSTSARR